MNNLLQNPLFSPAAKSDGSKVMPLDEAVKRFIKPEMMIHTCQTSIRWCSAIYHEIARQFWNTNAGMSIVGISMNYPQSILVHGKIVNKLITSYFGDPYIIPSPNRVYQRAYREGTLDIEHWSIYTIPLRLKAAALGLPFLPTHSLVGSTMAKDNSKDIKIIDDPSGNGKQYALVSAIQPDVSIVHAWMADSEGNAVFLTPLAENVYGALAAKHGVVLTVEKIVSTETIRKYSNLVKLPAAYVKSITEVPMGAHPSGLSKIGLDEIEVYGEDYDFVEEVHQAGKADDTFQAWIDKWVLSCADHEEYLAKLGFDRILKLKGRSFSNSWKVNITAIEKVSKKEQYTPVEMAIIAMSRILEKRVKEKQYKSLLAGAGIANLSSWLAYYKLKESGYTLELMAEIGMFGYVPCPTDPALFNTGNFDTCKVTTDIHSIMGIFVGGKMAHCLGALGAAQIDEMGNINTTKLDEKSLMVGSGGANDVTSAAKEVAVIIPQGKAKLKKKVGYITSAGDCVNTIVTTGGIYQKTGSNDRFTLTGYFSMEGESLDEAVENLKNNSSWSFDVADNPEKIDPPTEKELSMLRLFDPDRNFIGKL